MTVSAYLDTNIVSSLARNQNEDEANALRTLLRTPGVSVCTSRKMKDELDRIPAAEHRDPQIEIYEELAKVRFVSDSFQGQPTVSSQQSRVVGYLPDPKVVEIESCLRGPQNDRPVDRPDAEHLFQALSNGVAYFVTLDRRTILRARADIEAAYPIRLRRPSELLHELGGV